MLISIHKSDLANQKSERCLSQVKKSICPIRIAKTSRFHVFTCKKNWYVQSKATKVHEFWAKIPFRHLQLAASSLCKLLHRYSRRKDYNLSTVSLVEKRKTSEILFYISLSMKKSEESQQNNSRRGKNRRRCNLVLVFFLSELTSVLYASV